MNTVKFRNKNIDIPLNTELVSPKGKNLEVSKFNKLKRIDGKFGKEIH